MKDIEYADIISFFQKILFISFFLISSKWFISFLYFDESINLRVINDVTDSSYFPLIKSFSELSFNPSYSKDIEEIKIISFPIIGLLINSIFFKIFGSFSFILLEFICVALFILIFSLILKKLNFSNISSITYSTFLFILPTIISGLAFLNIEFLNLVSVNFNTFYSLRFPRPIVSNLFLFSFIFFIIKFYINKDKDNDIKIIFLLILLMTFTLHIFFYFFIFQFFLLLFIYLDKFKLGFTTFIINNFKAHILFVFLIIFSYLAFYYQIQLSEIDYSKRMGLVEIDNSKKKILLKYLINFFTRKEFIFLFFINTCLFVFFRNNIIKIFYYFFLSTIISTSLFILIYNKGIDYYHFFNWILSSGLLYLIIILFYFFETKLLSNIKNKSKNILYIFLILIFIVLLNLSNSLKQIHSYKLDFKDRNELNNLTNFFKKNKNVFTKNKEILNLNYRFSIWLILNDYNEFSIVPISFWTPKKTSRIENELISVFKLFSLNQNDFLNFLSNKKIGNRYKNSYVEHYFDRIYLANRLRTFDENNFYTEIEKDFIKKNSPLITHQLIIPQNEFLRLKNKFLNSSNIIDPDFIVMDFSSDIFNKKNIDTNVYCLGYESSEYQVFAKKNVSNFCKKFKN